MITLLILGGAAVAAIVAGASLRRKNAGREASAERDANGLREANVNSEANTKRELNVGRTLQSDITSGRTENAKDTEPVIESASSAGIPSDVTPSRTESPAYVEPSASAMLDAPDTDPEPTPASDPEPLPDADPEPIPITEPEPQQAPEPPPSPEPRQPTIISREANVGRTLQSDITSVRRENAKDTEPVIQSAPSAGIPSDVTPSRTESPTYVEPSASAMLGARDIDPEPTPATDPAPLPDADPEPIPITEPEPQPAPEPPRAPEPPQPTIIVAPKQAPKQTITPTGRLSRRQPTRPPVAAIMRGPKSERTQMSRIVKGGLIQTSLACDTSESLDKIREAQTERTIKYIDQAGAEGVQVLCMQEIFTGPYFCAEQSTRWYDSVEKIPDGPTTKLMQEYAKKYNMVIVVPLYEEEDTGVYYNTAAVIDADGKYLGKYRKNHIPHVAPGFWEKFYFRPGNLGYPVFETAYAKVGVYICYDRHFPEGARELGLAGAEILMNPSATVAGLSEYLWKLEQPAHAVANGYFVGAINRVGYEAPWNIGEFYGQSYFCDPRGQMLAVGPRDADALVTADLDMDKIREVRNTWQFYRDRRPETYTGIVRL